jgi:hypothetical protein
MMIWINRIFNFITDPKNTRLLLFVGAIILVLLLLRQCNQSKYLKGELEKQKMESLRVSNNYEAAMDTIRKYKVDGNTWRSEKAGYELTLDELKNEYKELLGDFEIEKNKPPKVVIKTEYVIKEVINNVPVYVTVDANGDSSLVFSDTAKYDAINYRMLSGKIPYKLVYNSKDSTYSVVPGKGGFMLEQGVGLNLGLFKDKKTGKVSIKVDTDYPGITFTKLEGASIMDDPDNRKVVRSMRKPFSIGLSAGYGLMLNTSTGTFGTGPYIGFGINYSPKFLQFGK